MKIFHYLVFLSLPFFFISCSVGRYLESPVHIYIEGVDNITTTGNSEKYIGNKLVEEYNSKFFSEMETAMESYNLIPTYTVPQQSVTYFKININTILFNESYTVEEVYPDSTSVFPEIYNVVSCDITTGFEIYKSGMSGWYHVKDKSVVVSKEEEVSNNRTFFQILFGLNKDNSVSTYHELNSDVFSDLAGKAARRVAAKTSSIIDRELR